MSEADKELLRRRLNNLKKFGLIGFTTGEADLLYCIENYNNVSDVSLIGHRYI